MLSTYISVAQSKLNWVWRQCLIKILRVVITPLVVIVADRWATEHLPYVSKNE